MAKFDSLNIVYEYDSPNPPKTSPYISGITKREGVATSMRLMVCDRLNGKVLASGKSKNDGSFKRFLPADYVTDKQCFVVTFDDQGIYNAQISDLINAVT